MSVQKNDDKIFIGNCIVSVFDILGFKNFIVNNLDNKNGAFDFLIEKIKEQEHDSIASIPLHIKRNYKNVTDDLIIDIINRTKVNILADNIIIYLNIDDIDKDYTMIANDVFISICSTTAVMFFINGLPLRGAIDFGKCWVYNDRVYLGMPFVTAHNIVNKLEFSGIIVTDEAQKKLNRGNYPVDAITKMPAPLKNKPDNKSYVLDWTVGGMCLPRDIHPVDKMKDDDKDSLIIRKQIINSLDVRKIIYEAFSRHNKYVMPQNTIKLNNTEMMVRGFIMNYYESLKRAIEKQLGTTPQSATQSIIEQSP